MPPWRNVRPMLLPWGALFNPASDQIDLFCIKLFARIDGWHPPVFIFTRNAVDDQTFIRRPGTYHLFSTTSIKQA